MNGVHDVHLVTRQTCPTCGGERTCENPDWTALLNKFARESRPVIDLENGYAKRWFKARGYDEAPPLEVPCSTCDATGIVEGTIPLGDLLESYRAGEAAARHLRGLSHE